MAIAAEWAQMLSPKTPACDWSGTPAGLYVRGCDAWMLGHHPNRGPVNRYFAGWEIAHPVLSFALPHPYRTWWQGSTLAFEVIVARQNYQTACVWHF